MVKKVIPNSGSDGMLANLLTGMLNMAGKVSTVAENAVDSAVRPAFITVISILIVMLIPSIVNTAYSNDDETDYNKDAVRISSIVTTSLLSILLIFVVIFGILWFYFPSVFGRVYTLTRRS